MHAVGEDPHQQLVALEARFEPDGQQHQWYRRRGVAWVEQVEDSVEGDPDTAVDVEEPVVVHSAFAGGLGHEQVTLHLQPGDGRPRIEYLLGYLRHVVS